MPRWSDLGLLLLLLPLLPACSMLPKKSVAIEVYNPFPQLHKVAVVPFFNHTNDPTVDGDRFAHAYYAELQKIPGFQVVPVEVVKQTILQHRLPLASNGEFRQLAQLLAVDAVIAGSITEFSPYYPPRLGLAVAWHTANAGYHSIPPGYGMPECATPEDIRFEAEFVHAREHMSAPGQSVAAQFETDSQAEPIMTHVRLYDGRDADFTAALAEWFWRQNDRRYGDWRAYLSRSDDFISFCVHLHLRETLALRGGARQTTVAWIWPHNR